MSQKPLPPALDPLCKVRALGADRRVKAVAGQHDRFGREGEELRVDRVDDRGKVAALERGVAWSARKERVASEEKWRALHVERDAALGVPGIVDGGE
ncbi:MAG: hypothetical protein RLZ84_1524, partial [Actinomycetota bacterium]